MKSCSSRELLEILKKEGGYEVGYDGDYHQYKHPIKKGKVTLTHPRKDIPAGTLKSISKQSEYCIKCIFYILKSYDYLEGLQ